MADLTTARTRLGLWGHATRPGNFGLPVVVGPPAPELGTFGGFVTAEDAVLTLLAASNAAVARVTTTDSVVPVVVAMNDEGTTLIVSDGAVTRAAASEG